MERVIETRRSRDFTSYLQDKVKKNSKEEEKKRAINERAKLQKELDNLVGDALE